MPVSLFYIQGLNTTAVHAHTALFGVYGFQSLGFVFLIARYIRPEVEFNDKLMKFGFWALNIGLALMVLISLLPIGLINPGQVSHMVCGLLVVKNLCNNHCYKTYVGLVLSAIPS